MYKYNLSKDYEKLWEIASNQDIHIVMKSNDRDILYSSNVAHIMTLINKDFFIKKCEEMNIQYIMPEL